MHCLPEPTQPTATSKVSFCEVLIWISGYGSLLVTFCLDLRGWVFSCELLSRISGDGPLLVSFCPAFRGWVACCELLYRLPRMGRFLWGFVWISGDGVLFVDFRVCNGTKCPFQACHKPRSSAQARFEAWSAQAAEILRPRRGLQVISHFAGVVKLYTIVLVHFLKVCTSNWFFDFCKYSFFELQKCR